MNVIISAMRRSVVRAYCLSFPGAEETLPFGAKTSVFKVGGKMFGLCQLDESPLRISVNCEPELAEHVIIDGSLREQMIEDSYDLVAGDRPDPRRRALK